MTQGVRQPDLRSGKHFCARSRRGRNRAGIYRRQKTGCGGDRLVGDDHISCGVVKIRDVPRLLMQRRMQLPTKPEVKSESPADFPVVLGEKRITCGELVG